MKKLLLFFFMLSGFFGAEAQNNVTVFSEDGYPFYLIMNGVRQNETPETNIRLEGLTPQMFTAKVIFNDQSIPEIDKKFFAVATEECNPCDVTYKIKTNKKGEVVMKVFAFTPLYQAPPPPSNVTVVQYNTTPMPAPVLGVQVSETVTTTSTVGGTSENVSVGMNVGGFNVGMNVNVNDGYGSGVSTTTTTTSTTTMTNTAPAQTVVVSQPGCLAMDNVTLNSLLSSMRNQSFDEEKLTIAKQATSANCLTAQQIRSVMNEFDWEDNRLDYAKFAYGYCLDQNNYWQVNDAFEWDDSIQELNNAIGR